MATPSIRQHCSKALGSLSANFRLSGEGHRVQLSGPAVQVLSVGRRVRLTDDEDQRLSRSAQDYYRICFAHRLVQGILMWGFWEGANWIPVSSLYRRDWSETPAARAYRDLVYRRVVGTSLARKTDAQGRCEVRVFFGKHRIVAGERSRLSICRVPKGSRRSLFETDEACVVCGGLLTIE